LAEAIIFLLENKNASDIGEIINVGTGADSTIRELAELVASIIGYTGEVVWDTTKPNGTPQKLLDVSRIMNMGWKAKISLPRAILSMYEDFLLHL
jgi:GDP-L-fucose synthase